MIIESTNIADVDRVDGAAGKIILMDRIVNQFTPLFNEELKKKRDHLDSNLADIKKLKKSIGEIKTKLQMLNSENNCEQLKSEILQNIQFLNGSDVLYGNRKHIVKTILDSLDSASESKLQNNLLLPQCLSKII